MKRIALAFAAFAAMFALIPAAAMAATTPTVTGVSVTTSSTTTATVAASINIEEDSYDTLQGDACELEYGTSTSYGTTVDCPTAPTTGSSTAVPESFVLTGLTPGTPYDYEIVVTAGSALLGLGGATNSPATGTFTTPTTTTPPTATTAAATGVGGSAATLNGTVNPENFSITSCTFTYTPSGGTAKTATCATTPSGSSAATVSAAVTGLSEGTAYTYTLAVGYGSGTSAATVTSTASPAFTTPSATVGTPAQLTATSATLNGTVDPEGQTVTDCEIYYGTSVSTLAKSPCSVAPSAITGTSPTTVAAAVTGLAPSTQYIDTVVLTTAEGTAVAPAATFTTPAEPVTPKATAGAATAVTSTTAVLHAVVNAGGQGIEGCEFIFGYTSLTTTQGEQEALTQKCKSTPADNGSQDVTVTLKGLAPGTKYYVRLVFETYGGLIESNQITFDTKTHAAKPSVKITSVTVDSKARTAKVKFARTGSTVATKGFECALATVTKNKVGAIHYTKCLSGKTYTKLKDTTYVFYVRAGDGAGEGTAKSKRFTL